MKVLFYFVFCVAHSFYASKKTNVTIKMFIWLFISVISFFFSLLSRQSNKTH